MGHSVHIEPLFSWPQCVCARARERRNHLLVAVAQRRDGARRRAADLAASVLVVLFGLLTGGARRQMPGVLASVPMVLLGLLSGGVTSALGSDAANRPLIAHIDEQVLRTGDAFEYRIAWVVDRPYDELVLPDSLQFAPDFVVRSMQADTSADTLVFTYTLQLFGIDVEQVPALKIGVRTGTDTTFIPVEPLPVRYEARVEHTEEELRPLKPIFPFFRNWWPLVLASLLVLLGLLAALWWWIRRRQAAALMPSPKPPPQPEPYVCPLETLNSEFERIRAGIPHPERDVIQWYTALSEAVRRYLDQVHCAGSMESTTSQTLRTLSSAVYEPPVVKELGHVLHQADLVKFARQKPVNKECLAFFADCQALGNTFARADRQLLESRRMAYETELAAQSEAGHQPHPPESPPTRTA